MEWHRASLEEVIKELGSSTAGLSNGEARLRLERYGPNRLREPEKESRLLKFIKQFTEFIILVLIGAAFIAGLLGEWVDSIAILAIVVLNGVISFSQEGKAEKVLETLKKLSAPKAKVMRDGAVESVDAGELVPGDVIVIEAGDMVPADSRIAKSEFLKVDESPLTGESHPVDKDPGKLEDNLPLADRRNMAYSGTTVVYGRGRAIVTSTAMSTELGRIAGLLEEVKPEPTPLQKKLAEFGRLLVYGAGGVCALIFILGILRGEKTLDMFLTAVSLAVAAIPEGLPAVVTITLSIGVQRMVRRHALIRKLPSVETLGSAAVIASDKTGTLTQNQMTVKKVYLSTGEVLSVSGAGYEPEGSFFEGTKEIEPLEKPVFLKLLHAALLCNTAELNKKDNNNWQVIGDPTEGALLSLALKAGLKKEELHEELHFESEIPFDAERKMMTSIYKDAAGNYHLFTKGAPEMVLPLCASIYTEGLERPVTGESKEGILRANDGFSKEALRVLALGYRVSDEPIDIHSIHSVETSLSFLGLAGMIDPPREEAFLAVEKARDAGITPLMITGDHRLTATAIAKEIGIFRDGDVAVTGEELDRMGPEEFERNIARIKVYARVNPEHKLKIVRAWKERGEIIAMTGDGVNDAPALKEADIGIAMGIAGTDVTKEAADMVLTDDNFASIISAVEEGRGIFDNIRKVVHYLLSCNIGEITTLFLASVLGMPLPLLPVQILWMNLITDGLPALGLAMEPCEPGIMDRKPRPRQEGVVTGPLFRVMVMQGIFMALCALFVYALELYFFKGGLEKARTMAFIVVVYSQMFHVFNCRSERGSVFSTGSFTNRTLNMAVFSILVTQIMLVHIPWLAGIFRVTGISLAQWVVAFAVSVQPLLWMEVIKAARRKEHD
ncbi:MAG: cation-translocating P-type ATPase [Deltaproteobacteria bacterium]|nr:cation-translocating P-type ATPase [Deltaproteobacteria bacterium]